MSADSRPVSGGALPPAALLAGGRGTRMRSLAGNTPKLLLPVEGRPFLAHLLEGLSRQEVKTAVLCTGHAAEQVWDAAQTHIPEGMRLVESREDEPLGTGGAIRNALPLLDQEFFIVNGDTYLETSLRMLWRLHRDRDAALSLALVRSENAAEKGTVRVSPDGRVLGFREKVKDGTGLINGGVYVARAWVFSRTPEGVACSLEREIIPGLLEAGEVVMGRIVEDPFVDIGLPEDYLRVRDRLPRPWDRR